MAAVPKVNFSEDAHRLKSKRNEGLNLFVYTKDFNIKIKAQNAITKITR